jgi:N-methylhydantoinase A
VDIGGTFTDCVVVDADGNRTIAKALSTPDDFSIGVIDAIGEAAAAAGVATHQLLGSTSIFFHACTVGENTLITRTGAKTGLLTTRGFADILPMMRGKTWEGLSETEAAHLSALSKPDPIIARPWIEEITERVDYKGAVLLRLDSTDVERALDRLIATGVESVAVCLLWSIANGSHERLVFDTIAKRYPSVFVSLSSRVAPYLGEYERTASTAISAYIGPKISSYLHKLDGLLQTAGLSRKPLIMQAYGGVLDLATTCENPIGTIESGPAAGVVGSQSLGRLIGVPNILATDMGGTTFKVSLVTEDTIEKDYRPTIVRHNILATKIWIESIGAGGGSIAWIDPESGLLKVGPQGAGAKPGPACYNLGGAEPTVADAVLVLGYLNDGYFLGGRMRLDKAKAADVIREKIADPLGLSVLEAARGVYVIANSHMSDLIRKATIERGHDPRNFVMFAYGGASPVHASRYAAELGISDIVVPFTSSVHGANGLVTSDVMYQYGKSNHLVVPADVETVNEVFAGLTAKAFRDLANAGFGESDVTVIRSLDMRYRYQVHELNVSLAPGAAQLGPDEIEETYSRFDRLYETCYGQGSAYREAGKEIVTFRVTASAALPKPRVRLEARSSLRPETALKGTRPVYFEEDRALTATPIYNFGRMRPGMEIPGPAIIESPVTTIVVNPKDRAIVDELRNVRISVGA